MTDKARIAALDGLAGLLRSGLDPMTALRRWPRDVPTDVRPEILAAAARVEAGIPPREVLAPIERSWGEIGRTLTASFGSCLTSGSDLAAAVDDLTSSIRESGGRERTAHAAAAGARLSGRLVLALPIGLVVLSAALRGGPDPASLGPLALGAVLGGLGSFWIARLTPRPPSDDPLALLVERMSNSMAAGASFPEALSEPAAASSELQPRLKIARDLIDLGIDPRSAFDRAGLPEVAERVAESIELGVPLSGCFRSLARARRAEAAAEFEARLRRAPVLMAIPLSLCLLPSFVLIGLAPLIDVL